MWSDTKWTRQNEHAKHTAAMAKQQPNVLFCIFFCIYVLDMELLIQRQHQIWDILLYDIYINEIRCGKASKNSSLNDSLLRSCGSIFLQFLLYFCFIHPVTSHLRSDMQKMEGNHSFIVSWHTEADLSINVHRQIKKKNKAWKEVPEITGECAWASTVSSLC